MVVAAGLDLSLTASGVALARPDLPDPGDRYRLALVGEPGITNLSVAAQIHKIDDLAARIVAGVLDTPWPPTAVVVEALDNAQSYGGVTERAILWWKVIERLYAEDIPVYIPPSAQVKIYATGNGNAKKGEVIATVTRQWPEWHHGGNDNLVDAAAMAELGLALCGSPTIPLTKAHTRVLENIRRLDSPPARTLKKAAKS